MAGNHLKRFRGLLPTDPTLVGSVQSVNINGTLEVLLVGGGKTTVTGSGYAPGSRVFVKGGEVVSAAPSLSAILIEV